MEITRSERIVANQRFADYEKSIKWDEKKYKANREASKSKAPYLNLSEDSDVEMTEEELKAFWDAPSQNTPEDRIAIAKKSRKIKNIDRNREEKEKKKTKVVKLFTNDGRPLNINQSRIPFTLKDDDENGCKVLDVSVYR